MREEEVRTDQGENDYCVFLLLLVKEEIEDGDREASPLRHFQVAKIVRKKRNLPPPLEFFFIFVTNCYVYYCYYYFYQWNVSQLLSSCRRRRRRPIVLCRLYTHRYTHALKTVRMLCNKQNRKLSGRGAGAQHKHTPALDYFYCCCCC